MQRGDNIKRIYIDICFDLKKYLALEELKGKKINKKNKKYIDKTLKKIKIIKYCFYGKYNICEQLIYNSKTFFIIYAKKDIAINGIERIIKKILKQYDKDTGVLISYKLIRLLDKSSDMNINNIVVHNRENKEIYEDKLIEILENVIKLRTENKQENNVYITINNENKIKYNNIIYLLKDYKSVNIVTNNLSKLRRIEDSNKLYDIPITIGNNKKKSLIRAKYIINVDFDNKLFNEYCINREAIIFNIYKEKLTNIMGFSGTIINNIKIKQTREYYKNIERNFVDYIPEKLSFDKVKFVGNNGIISLKEIQRVKY